MKIAILTLPLHTNYGGILQAYALQTVLERMGHVVEHLQPKKDYPPLHQAWQMPLVWGKRLIRKYIGGDRRIPIFEDPRRWVRKNTDSFIEKFINIRWIENNGWDNSLADDYDAIIVGSDQVWRPCMSNDYLELFFGSFIEGANVLRVAYSASFGVDENEFSDCQIEKIKPMISKFNALSVREESGIRLCDNLFGLQACCTLDPTMLLDHEDYEVLSIGAKKRRGSLMSYVLDRSNEADAFIENTASRFGLVPFSADSKVELYYLDRAKVLSECQQPPVENWLRSFRDSEFVITDSFHACVFSILFKKPFLCLGNNFRGMARFHSLLGQFGLMDRLVSLDNPTIPEKEIDWNRVYGILEAKRKESLGFLMNALS